MLRDGRGGGVSSVCRLTLRASRYKSCNTIAREHLTQRGLSLANESAAGSGGAGAIMGQAAGREVSYRRSVPRLKLSTTSYSLRVASSTPVGTRLLAFEWEYAKESERVALARDFEAGTESELQVFVNGPDAPVCSRPQPTFILLPGALALSTCTLIFIKYIPFKVVIIVIIYD